MTTTRVLVRIAMHLLVFVVMYHRAVNKMVLQPTMLPVSVDLLNVLLLVRIATNLQVLVELYRIVTKKMVLQPTMLPVSVDQQNVPLILVSIVLNLLVRVVMDQLVVALVVQ